MTADITFDTTHHAQVEAFADMQRQRDRMEDERDTAILRAEQAERESGELRELAEWLVSMDDPDDSAGLYARRSVTLTAIINRARTALATAELGGVA